MKDEYLPEVLEQDYASVAPDPKQWPALVAKVREQAREFKGWRPEDIQSILLETRVSFR